jgi:hypothetical protein
VTMRDYQITKPASIRGYEVHRMVAELCNGDHYLFVDRGDHLIVRTSAKLNESGIEIRSPLENEILGFDLRASVALRSGGKNIYPASGDWRTRRQWLEKQGIKRGFEILAVHVGDRRIEIESKGRKYWIDCTEFKGILAVRKREEFLSTLEKGVGRVGRAFGMGMLII